MWESDWLNEGARHSRFRKQNHLTEFAIRIQKDFLSVFYCVWNYCMSRANWRVWLCLQVANVLNHTAGLQNALSDALKKNPMMMCNWSDTLAQIAEAVPESSPGADQQYHTLTYGWLCGGIAEVWTYSSIVFNSLLQWIESLIIWVSDSDGSFEAWCQEWSSSMPPWVEENWSLS